MGYDVFDHYDLGQKDQKASVATRFGNQDELLRLVAVAHANGLEVYPDIVLNHAIGGREDPDAPGDKFKRFRYRGFGGADDGRWPKDHPDFHPNPGHQCTDGDICEQKGSDPTSATAIRITSAAFHTAGAIWAAATTKVKVSVFTDGARKVELRVAKPDAHGGKSTSSGKHGISGKATNDAPLELEFTAAREGYHQLAARLTDSYEQPTGAYVKVEYEAPARSQLIEP